MIGLGLKQEIENTFQMVPARCTPEEITFLCPEPGCGDKTGNRSLNLKSGKTNCWRCGKGGNFIGWAAKLGHRFTNTMDAGAGTGILDTYVEPVRQTTLLPPVRPIAMPNGYTRILDEPTSVYTRLITAMAERKHLLYDDLADVHVGFTRLDPKWEEYALFPVVERGVVVYYQGRTYIDKPDQKTKLFPSRHELKYGARYWVYNLDEVLERHPPIVVAVESILNVLSLKWKLRELGWENEVVPVAVFKHKVSVEQWLKITRCPGVKEVCLLFDHDAIDTSWSSSGMLTNRANVTIAEMPAGESNARLDPNDDVEAAIAAFEAREPYTKGNSLKHSLGERNVPSLKDVRVL